MTKARLNMMGRFGNQLFQYAHARALCELNGWDLCTDPWFGERVMDVPIADRSRDCEITLHTDYHQKQDSLKYTRSQVRDWFRIKQPLWESVEKESGILCHRRLGDYLGLGFTVVSEDSYYLAVKEHQLPGDLVFVTEYGAKAIEGIDPELMFIVDFIRMMKADILLRSNSTFSWWAATLGNAEVYSPIIDGLPGGVQDCKFVRGNWPKTFNIDFVENLHLSP